MNLLYLVWWRWTLDDVLLGAPPPSSCFSCCVGFFSVECNIYFTTVEQKLRKFSRRDETSVSLNIFSLTVKKSAKIPWLFNWIQMQSLYNGWKVFNSLINLYNFNDLTYNYNYGLQYYYLEEVKTTKDFCILPYTDC